MGFSIKLSGPPAISAAFQDFSGIMIRYALQEPVDFAFKRGEQIARTEVPVRTGFLRSSIRSERMAMGAKLIAAAPYALYVDKRVPYFSNAVAEIQRILPQLVQRAIDEQAGRLTRKYFGG